MESIFQQVIDGSILCVHGGLSPDIRTLDQVSMWTQKFFFVIYYIFPLLLSLLHLL